MTISYPTAVWDGDSETRDSDTGKRAAPDWHDWERIISEVAAAQTELGVGAAVVPGAAAGTGVVAAEDRKAVNRTILTITDLTVAAIDEAGVTAYLSQKIYDFPEGAVLILGATVNLAITKSSAGVNADWDGDIGLGSVAANNDATPLATTEQNIVPNTATPQAVAGVVASAHAQSTATENAVIDGTATAVDVYLNLLIDDADQDVTTTPCNMIFNGTITLTWVNLGDY